MPANTSPIFTLTPVVGAVCISTANTALNGTGTMGTLVTGGASGTRIEIIEVDASATVTNGMVRIFLGMGGATYLWHEITIAAATPSATVPAFNTYWIPPEPLTLPSGKILFAATNNAEPFIVFARGGDYL